MLNTGYERSDRRLSKSTTATQKYDFAMSRELADGLAVTAMTVRMEVSIHATAGSFALSRQRAGRVPSPACLDGAGSREPLRLTFNLFITYLLLFFVEGVGGQNPGFCLLRNNGMLPNGLITFL